MSGPCSPAHLTRTAYIREAALKPAWIMLLYLRILAECLDPLLGKSVQSCSWHLFHYAGRIPRECLPTLVLWMIPWSRVPIQATNREIKIFGAIESQRVEW